MIRSKNKEMLCAHFMLAKKKVKMLFFFFYKNMALQIFRQRRTKKWRRMFGNMPKTPAMTDLYCE